MKNPTHEKLELKSPIEEVLAEALSYNMVHELWTDQKTLLGQLLVFDLIRTLPEGSYLLGDDQLVDARLEAAKLGWGMAAKDKLPKQNVLWDSIMDSVGPLQSHNMTTGTYTLTENELRILLEKEYQNAQILKDMGYELDRGV